MSSPDCSEQFKSQWKKISERSMIYEQNQTGGTLATLRVP